ncbi:hypothetical protein ACJX0J_032967, partial [Zea mays]
MCHAALIYYTSVFLMTDVPRFTGMIHVGFTYVRQGEESGDGDMQRIYDQIDLYLVVMFANVGKPVKIPLDEQAQIDMNRVNTGGIHRFQTPVTILLVDLFISFI